MKYRLPEINDKDILQKYVQEHHNNGETSISASLGLSSSDLVMNNGVNLCCIFALMGTD